MTRIPTITQAPAEKQTCPNWTRRHGGCAAALLRGFVPPQPRRRMGDEGPAGWFRTRRHGYDQRGGDFLHGVGQALDPRRGGADAAAALLVVTLSRW